MAIIKTVEGKTPRWGKNCFIAENAVLTGDCILGDDCSIWYSAVLRSDVDAILLGVGVISTVLLAVIGYYILKHK